MNLTTFEQYRALIREHSGICLGPGKEALVSSRIAKRIRELSLEDEMSYLRYVQAEESIDELTRLIDLVSTNVTHFLREPIHFEYISKQLRVIWNTSPKQVKYWSAACSTGQEPFTLAMFVHEIAAETGVPPQSAKILATDISTRVLQKAFEGVYTASEVESLPKTWISKYFSKHRSPGCWEVKQSLKSLITFKRLNLSSVPYPMQGPMDAILCRNVMIYFDLEIRARIIAQVERLLSKNGLFAIGHSESLSGIEHSLKTTCPTVYEKR